MPQMPVLCFLDTEYDRAKVPSYNGNSPNILKTLLFRPLVNKVENKGTQGVRARYDAEYPPLISIVWGPGRPIILGMDIFLVFWGIFSGVQSFGWGAFFSDAAFLLTVGSFLLTVELFFHLHS